MLREPVFKSDYREGDIVEDRKGKHYTVVTGIFNIIERGGRYICYWIYGCRDHDSCETCRLEENEISRCIGHDYTV